MIQIRVPSGDIDVNVHPAKTEVRFLREQIVFAELQRSVRAALLDLSPVPGVTRMAPVRGWSERSERPAATTPNPLWPDPLAATPLGQMRSSLPGEAVSAVGLDGESGATAPFVDAPDGVAPTPQRALPVMRVIGQTQDTYIIAEGPDGVYLIDQHAAHERVLFEEIGERVARHASESQQLLAPDTVELEPHQEDVLTRHGELLKDVGYTIEPFGPRAVLVRAVPKVLGRESASQGLLSLLDSLAEGGSPGDWREHLITSLACHASVTAGRRMSTDESRELVRRLEETQQPHTCPHGRPTMIHLSAASLAREFQRR